MVKKGEKQPMHTVKWTAGEKKARAHLGEYAVEPTRFVSRDFLEMAGIAVSFDDVLMRMGLGVLRHMDPPTYPMPTLDFLATYEFNFKNPHTPYPRDGIISFKIKNKAYTLSTLDLCNAYQFDARKQTTEFDEFSLVDQIWHLLGGSLKFESKYAKIMKVRNPVCRLVLKLLANTFSGKSTSATASRTELCLLFQGLKAAILGDPNGEDPWEDDLGYNVNLGCVMASALVKYKAGLLRGKPSQCVIGGWLTPLFIEAGVNLSEFTPLPVRLKMDYMYLQNTRYFTKSPNPAFLAYSFIDNDGAKKTCVLPNNEWAHPTSIRNIHFTPSEEEAMAPINISTSQGQPFMAEQGQSSRRPQSYSSPPASPGSDDEMPPTYVLPDLDFEPKTQLEKFLAKVISVQRNINKWQSKMIVKLRKKLRKTKSRTPSPHATTEEEHGEPTDETEPMEEGLETDPEDTETESEQRKREEYAPVEESEQTDPAESETDSEQERRDEAEEMEEARRSLESFPRDEPLFVEPRRYSTSAMPPGTWDKGQRMLDTYYHRKYHRRNQPGSSSNPPQDP